jgi:hypothetical protein
VTYETENWPFVQAKWFTKVDRAHPRTVRLIVIHDMEWKVGTNTAEDCAHDFATRPASSKASAHICVDVDSIVQCVYDRDVAYAAPGANNDGIQIELAGFKRFTLCEWMSETNLKVLLKGADAAAQYCLKYDIPPIHISDTALRSGAKGIIGHDQASRVYRKSDHSDPGGDFPWTFFIASVATFVDHRRMKAAA